MKNPVTHPRCRALRAKTSTATRLMAVVMLGLVQTACTSMLTGSTGASAGRPIGTDTRSSATVNADNRISATIRARYRADAELGPAALRVETRQGRVTLRGELAAFDQRDRAERLARDVAGVRYVSNQISVRQ